MNPYTRRIDVRLRQHDAQVDVDESGQRVRIVLLPRFGGWRFPLLGLLGQLALLGLAAASLPSPSPVSWGLVSVGLAIVLLDGVPRLLRRDEHVTVAIDVDLGQRTVRVGDRVFALDGLSIDVTASEWRLGNHGDVVGIGNAWGGPGGTWLQQMLTQLAEGSREALVPPAPLRSDLTRSLVTLWRSPARIVSDHAGVTAERTRPWVGLQGVLALGIVSFALLAGPTLMGFVAMGVGALLVGYELLTWGWYGGRQRRVRIDPHALVVQTAGRERRWALTDVVAVHLTPTHLQVDLHDGPSFTFGHGWAAASLRELHGHLVDAVALAEPEPTLPPEVPRALVRLRQEAQRE